MDQQEFFAIIGETMVNGGRTPKRLDCPECHQLMELTRQQLEQLEELTGVGPMLGCCCREKESAPYLVVRIPIEQRVTTINTAEVWLKVMGTESIKKASKVAKAWVKTQEIDTLHRDNVDETTDDGQWEVKGPVTVQPGNEHEDEPDYSVVVGT